ncbi:MDR family MFS transporter [Bombilactobacillus thymidiniphilus]|uniref:MFS transporter n=1 Tax=Bombilactobacillus thymidiniphilus TaxID=2923363 RepID=A0ABY4PEJ2_9LACO|nr:MFS transporter [Bombilactobacillus thymidiniphilus]UQS84213.1 MFS transporter [Bombilactobacillus thymidiniphilus]
MKSEQQRWLLLMNIVFNLVMGFILPVNTVFMTKNLQESMVVAGAVLMLYSFVMMLGNFIGGYLFDRYSHRKTLLLGYCIAAVGFLTLSVFHTWPIYALILTFVGLGMGVAYTAVNSYTALVATQNRQHSQKIFNVMYLAANVGIAIGSMLVSLIFQRSIFLTFFLPALCFVGCIIIVLFKGAILDGTRNIEQQESLRQESHIQEQQAGSISYIRLRTNLFLLCISVLVVWLGYSQWDSNLSLYMLDNHLTMRDYSLLFSINAASLIIVQPLMNRFVSRLLKQIKYQITLGLLIMSSSFFFLPGAHDYLQYVISIIILTVGESITFPSIPAILNKFATEENRGRYQSFYVIFGSLGRAIGPYLGGLIATQYSFDLLFYVIIVAIAVVAVGTLLVKEE